ncbi:MAG: cation:proton antiporter [Bacteroidaceae bacterium]|nr:cation:proton antiporter [Bacteroidaceae bacterium]
MPALITDPTWIFLVMLLIILLVPVVFRRLRIPHIIGLILAGVLVGRHGFNILERDDSFTLFGQVGIYYIMFLAGLEMDMGSFRRHSSRGMLFGALTFIIPFVAGFITTRWWLGFATSTSLLISCILSSHTLVTYPIAGRLGLGKHPSVVWSVIATAISCFFALLMLAIVIQQHKGGGTWWFWLRFFVGISAYIAGVAYAFPKLGRWFLRRNEDAVTQYIFVLALLFLSACLAMFFGLEGLLGAFLCGLVINRVIPHGGPLMTRIEFVGNALFIPYFLVSVGMIIDIRVLAGSSQVLLLCGVLILVGTLSKWLASAIMRRITGSLASDEQMMFGLTNAHAAGALAIVMIGSAPDVALMDTNIINATVMLILFSCIISSIATEKAARTLALQTNELERNRGSYHGKCLTAYAYPQTVDALTQLSIMIRNPNVHDSLMGIAIAMDNDPDDRVMAQGRENLRQAQAIAAAADVSMSVMVRVASNVSAAISHAMKEVDAGEVILGLHERADGSLATTLGTTTQNILSSIHREVIAVRLLIPPSTFRRIVVAVPPKAEYEIGFYKWLEHLCRIGERTGQTMNFHTCGDTGGYIQDYLHQLHPTVDVQISQESGFGAMLVTLSEEMKEDWLLVIVTSRAGFISHTPGHNILPSVIARDFSNVSVMLVYPDQYGDPQESLSIFAPNGQSITQRHLLFEKWLNRNS